MKLSDLLYGVCVVGILGCIGLTSLKSCYDNYNHRNKPQQMQETNGTEPTTQQVRFGTYAPRDANSNYDSNSR